jgi:putative RNA 2'-phosphotransferase
LIDEVVTQNDKQRFIIEGHKIRANQGHSIDVNLGFKAVIPPNMLYHGTATRFLESIMKTGLSKQQRQHVHLSEALETAINVGKRHGKVVVLEVDARKMFEEGYAFYLSENGVWLTDIVPVGFLKESK